MTANKNNKSAKQRTRTNKPKQVDSTGGYAAIGLRNDFYKDGSNRMQIICLLSVICLGFSVALMFYSVQKTESNVYFATDPNGSLIKLVPLGKPNHSHAAVADWLNRALIDTFDFHHGNLEKKLNEAALKWFTANGASELISALDESNNFESIRSRKMFVTLALKHTPIVIKAGKPSWSKYYLWKLEGKGTMTYRTSTDEFSNDVLFSVIVSRKSMINDAMGLGVAKIIMTIE